MVIAIIILSILLAVAFLAMIFLVCALSKFAQESPIDVSKAYNDCYYQAKVLIVYLWSQEQESLVVDFSRWEDGVAAFIYSLREPRPAGLPRDWVVLDDALVYEVDDGIWMWKENEECC